MRVEFVDCGSYNTATKRCPWAKKIVKVDGGYRCFESLTDYENWKGKK